MCGKMRLFVRPNQISRLPSQRLCEAVPSAGALEGVRPAAGKGEGAVLFLDGDE